MILNQRDLEVNKNKSISELSHLELRDLLTRLRMEVEAQEVIFQLKRNSGEQWDYDHKPIVDTKTPIDQLYHHGIPGMKWGVRKKRKTDGAKPVQPKSDDYLESRSYKAKGYPGLSSSELKKLNERLQLERAYKDLTKNEKKRGKKLVEDILYDVAKSSLTSFGTTMASYGLAKVASSVISDEQLKKMLEKSMGGGKK